jgi:DUF4097 and DUF4098 domain-containing protein YvlB
VSSGTKRGRGWVILGLILMAAGLIFVVPAFGVPTVFGSLSRWLSRLSPLFLLLAGLARLAGFAFERKPRSPFDGTLLIAIGLVLLAGNANPGLSPLQLYGKYWPVLLAVIAGVQLLGYYSHRTQYGRQPSAFRPVPILLIGFVIATGVIANRVAATHPSFLSGFNLTSTQPARDARTAAGVEPYSFTEQTLISQNVPSGARITIDNRFGDVRVNGGSTSLRATLIKTVKAASSKDAREVADGIKLVVEKTTEGFNISAVTAHAGQQSGATIQVETPAAVGLSMNGSNGSLVAARIEGSVAVNATNGQVRLSDITGSVHLSLNNSDVEASRIRGDLVGAGARNAHFSGVSGGVDIRASNGVVEVGDVSGPVRVEGSSCRIRAEDLRDRADLRTRSGAVDVARATTLTVEAPLSEVRATDIRGDLRVNSSGRAITVGSVTGAIKIVADRSPVTADEINGRVDIETSKAAVSLRNFHGAVRLQTSYNLATLEAVTSPRSDIDVENNHGDIKLVLPGFSTFQLNATSRSGLIKPIGFGDYAAPLKENLSFGSGGPAVTLRTSYGSITLQASGAQQTQTLKQSSLDWPLRLVLASGSGIPALIACAASQVNRVIALPEPKVPNKTRASRGSSSASYQVFSKGDRHAPYKVIS